MRFDPMVEVGCDTRDCLVNYYILLADIEVIDSLLQDADWLVNEDGDFCPRCKEKQNEPTTPTTTT